MLKKYFIELQAYVIILLEPFKDQHAPEFYKRTQFIPRSKHTASVAKTSKV